jgi:hypothetical protein
VGRGAPLPKNIGVICCTLKPQVLMDGASMAALHGPRPFLEQVGAISATLWDDLGTLFDPEWFEFATLSIKYVYSAVGEHPVVGMRGNVRETCDAVFSSEQGALRFLALRVSMSVFVFERLLPAGGQTAIVKLLRDASIWDKLVCLERTISSNKEWIKFWKDIFVQDVDVRALDAFLTVGAHKPELKFHQDVKKEAMAGTDTAATPTCVVEQTVPLTFIADYALSPIPGTTGTASHFRMAMSYIEVALDVHGSFSKLQSPRQRGCEKGSYVFS